MDQFKELFKDLFRGNNKVVGKLVQDKNDLQGGHVILEDLFLQEANGLGGTCR